MDIFRPTMKKLAKDKRTESLDAIAKGAGVEQSWLARLSRGHYNDPGVQKIEKLFAYFYPNTVLKKKVKAGKPNR